MYDIFIPGEVAHDKRLNIATKYFYGVIRSVVGSTGVCFASNAYFRKAYEQYTGEEISDKQIQRYIATLRDCDIIDVVIVDNHKREIKLSTATPTKMSSHPDKNDDNIKQVYDDKGYYNNITCSAYARVDENTKLHYPNLVAWYERVFPSRDVFIEFACNGRWALNLDAIHVIYDALTKVSVYDYMYALKFDDKRLSRVLSYIDSHNVNDVEAYILKSFRAPDIWRDYSHVRALEDCYKQRA